MKLIPESLTTKIARTILVSKKNSPHIFFAAGIVGVVGGAVLACRATLQLEETLDDIQVDLKKQKTLSHSIGSYTTHPSVDIRSTPYTEQDYYKDLGVVYFKSTLKLGRLYGPAIVVGGVGIACLAGSHVQLVRRNSALTATLAAVMKAYDEYRMRVADELGTEKELEIHRAVKMQQAEIDGKKKNVAVTDENGWSPYARRFDDRNINWKPDSEYNRIFLDCQQRYWNQKLDARGHVFLNEVYDALGMDRSPQGAVVGWVKGGEGDGYIDFGIFSASSIGFINDSERSVVLDFNVDGVIYEKI